jgi:ribosomal protein S18 acetylase RimI-like enzyme
VNDPLRPREGAALRGALRVASLDAGHRARVEEILRATAVFRGEEVDVALELFDHVFGHLHGTPSAERGAGMEHPDSVSDSLDAPRSTLTRPAEEAGGKEPDYSFVGVFTDDGHLLGYACYGPTPDTDRTYDLYWIAVDPAAQGSGAGTRLLAEVERRLRESRGRMLVVETSSRDEYDATRAFYTARGYQEAARVGHFYAPGDDRVIYTKRLSAVSSRLSATEVSGTTQPSAENVVPGTGFEVGTHPLTSTTSPDGRGAAAQ